MNDRDYELLVQQLFEQNQFAIKYDLESMQCAMQELGLNSDEAPFTVLVGGTNGKGTVTSALHAAFVSAGLRCGLYTSPHLVDFRERIRINGRAISTADCVRIGRPVFDMFSGRNRPPVSPRALSYFELVTLMGLSCFRGEVDVQVIEVGLGGRLDATNCTDPDVSVITNVSLDHQAWLGNTIPEIAAEKARIARPDRPCVLLNGASGYDELVRETESLGARVITAQSDAREGPAASLALARHVFSVCTSLGFSGIADRTDLIWSTALQRLRWPGRQESRRYEGREYLIDGAHNEASLRACALWVGEELNSRRRSDVVAIIGCSPGRDVGAIFGPLLPWLSAIHCVPADAQRTLSPADVAAALREQTDAPIHVHSCFDAAIHATGDDLTLIVGSLYLVGTALKFFGETADSLSILADGS